jgi:hypothetical protein
VKAFRELELSGQANIEISNLDAEQFTYLLNGQGNVLISGRVDKQVVTMNGQGNYQAGNLGTDQVGSLESNIAEVVISGMGNVDVGNVYDALDATISGSGNIYYHGNPSVKQSVTGLGTVQQVP